MRAEYTQEQLEMAVELVTAGKMSRKGAAKTFNVPKSTLLGVFQSSFFFCNQFSFGMNYQVLQLISKCSRQDQPTNPHGHKVRPPNHSYDGRRGNSRQLRKAHGRDWLSSNP